MMEAASIFESWVIPFDIVLHPKIFLYNKGAKFYILLNMYLELYLYKTNTVH
jgi:hypothetical protein